jgi:hypothetical protein
MVKWVLWDFVLRLDCQYDGGKVPTISSSALLWRTAHCSRSRTNNNTATAALRRFRHRVNEGWPAYEAILRKNNIENTAFIYPGSIMVFITTQGTMKPQLQYHGVEQSIFLKNN